MLVFGKVRNFRCSEAVIGEWRFRVATSLWYPDTALFLRTAHPSGLHGHLLSRQRQLSESSSLGNRHMMKSVPIAVALAAMSVSACVSTPLAPGAAQVIVTRVAADVSSCKALGNIDLDAAAAGIDNAKNHAIGLGGDTVLDTTPTSIYGTTQLLRTGVIYRCGPAGTPASK